MRYLNRPTWLVGLIFVASNTLAESIETSSASVLPVPVSIEQSNSSQSTQEHPQNSPEANLIEVSKSDDQAAEQEVSSDDNEEGWVKEKVEPQTKKIERFVMPFTNWVEEKLHESAIANPAEQQAKKKSPKVASISLRQAIEFARQQHPGTVLSADRIKSENTFSYRIKILSKEGVVRVVSVAGNQKPKTKQEQP
ncbi:MAG: PepSY domain-containing protein [Pseudomonadales bacterium]|nr:PepSY domain-containing protein [Pseudomonadales bacterium]